MEGIMLKEIFGGVLLAVLGYVLMIIIFCF
jgi:hypothetical protein